jgi:hypothetical protein
MMLCGVLGVVWVAGGGVVVVVEQKDYFQTLHFA